MPKPGLVSLLGLVCAAAVAVRAGRPAPVYGPPGPPGPPPCTQLGTSHSTGPAPYPQAPAPPPPPYRLVRHQFPQRAPPPPPALAMQFGPPPPPPPSAQRYRVEQQGIWRYTAPVRDPPLREDEVPFQGLGASESVTMPEAPPFDPVLRHGPSALLYVRMLSARDPYFFPDFPHTMLVLSNQQHRLNNGLAAHRLGSIRPGSDFLRQDF